MSEERPETDAVRERGRRSGARRARPMRVAGILLLFVVLALGAAALYLQRELSAPAERGQPVEFEILPGWGASRIAQELEAAGLVRNATVFSAYVRVRDLDRSLGEGLYDLDPSLSAPEVADRLARGGRPRVARVVVPEGMRAAELAERLEVAGLGEAERFGELMQDPGELRPEFVPEGAGLEGYLFPASYEFRYDHSAEQIIGRMLERFRRELEPATLERLAAAGLTVHEWVILASMVQAEAGGDEEMGPIAGVFLNRLEIGMPLQSDPTVAYGLGKRLPELDALAGDIQSDHPWNTYTRGGLPAGPIGNPGSAALQSVLSPVPADEQGRPYLYFLHGSDGGEPVFRLNNDLEGHNRDIDRYLRNQ